MMKDKHCAQPKTSQWQCQGSALRLLLIFGFCALVSHKKMRTQKKDPAQMNPFIFGASCRLFVI